MSAGKGLWYDDDDDLDMADAEGEWQRKHRRRDGTRGDDARARKRVGHREVRLECAPGKGARDRKASGRGPPDEDEWQRHGEWNVTRRERSDAPIATL